MRGGRENGDMLGAGGWSTFVYVSLCWLLRRWVPAVPSKRATRAIILFFFFGSGTSICNIAMHAVCYWHVVRRWPVSCLSKDKCQLWSKYRVAFLDWSQRYACIQLELLVRFHLFGWRWPSLSSTVHVFLKNRRKQKHSWSVGCPSLPQPYTRQGELACSFQLTGSSSQNIVQ